MVNQEIIDLMNQLNEHSLDELQRLIKKYCKAVIELQTTPAPTGKMFTQTSDIQNRRYKLLNEFREAVRKNMIDKGYTLKQMGLLVGVSAERMSQMMNCNHRTRDSANTISVLKHALEACGKAELAQEYVDKLNELAVTFLPD